MTYGFNQIADKTRVANVPKGAEVLLETRFPYLTANQRRVVLKSTAIASGYPVMDDAEGYGRLNLFKAGAGYGNFNGDVTLNMDAALGGFNQSDQWGNDISGAGKLTKLGTGALGLNGNNTFTGGIDITQGTIRLLSEHAAGQGDVYVRANSNLNINTTITLRLKSNFTQLANSTLLVDFKSAMQPAVQIDQTASLNGLLNIRTSSILPAGTYTVLTAKSYRKLSKVTLNGQEITPIYQDNSLRFKIS